MSKPAIVRHPDAAAISDAAAALSQGALVAFPTETVYGLGADAQSDRAVAGIFAAKGRPQNNPLIVHVADRQSAETYATFPDVAQRLAAQFWPGPMTLVLPLRAGAPLSAAVTAGLPTVALRVPQHPTARSLLTAFDRGIAAPSANRSGHVSATTAAHVADDLGSRLALVLDDGATPLGLESTIVSVSPDGIVTLLRSGHITVADLEGVLNPSDAKLIDATTATSTAPSAPGQFASHYAPRAPVRLNAVRVAQGEAVLAFGPPPSTRDVPAGTHVINLSDTSDLHAAAHNLFASLRALDAYEPRAIAVVPIPDQGLGRAINDRLRRAAAPRSPNAALKSDL